jgi:hypothetical protein
MLILFWLALSVCGTLHGVKAENSVCAVSSYCVVEGYLTLHEGMPASVGVVETSSGCVALALERAIFDARDRWDGKYVRVAGWAYTQPAVDTVYWYKLKDRMVSLGVCDAGPVVYVENIEEIIRPD